MVEIEVPDDVEAMPRRGDTLFKVRSADLKRRVTPFESPPEGWRLRRVVPVDIVVTLTPPAADATHLSLSVSIRKNDATLLTVDASAPAERPRDRATLAEDIRAAFTVMGDVGVEARSLDIRGDTRWFVPKSLLKDLKRRLVSDLPLALGQRLARVKDAALHDIIRTRSTLPAADRARWTIRASDIGQLCAAAEALRAEGHEHDATLILSCEHMNPDALELALEALRDTGLEIGVALPPVIGPARGQSAPSLARACVAAFSAGVRRWEVANVSHPAWLRGVLGPGFDDCRVGGDHLLYAMNTESARFLECQGFDRVTIPVESDRDNTRQLLAAWPGSGLSPEILLLGWPALFLSDNCPWRSTAGGCAACRDRRRSGTAVAPDGSVLRIQTRDCRTVVTSERAYHDATPVADLLASRIQRFRVDFTHRSIAPRDVTRVVRSLATGHGLPPDMPSSRDACPFGPPETLT